MIVQVYVDGRHYVSYGHRCSAEDVHNLTINGDVSVLDVKFMGAFVS